MNTFFFCMRWNGYTVFNGKDVILHGYTEIGSLLISEKKTNKTPLGVTLLFILIFFLKIFLLEFVGFVDQLVCHWTQKQVFLCGWHRVLSCFWGNWMPLWAIHAICTTNWCIWTKVLYLWLYHFSPFSQNEFSLVI